VIRRLVLRGVLALLVLGAAYFVVTFAQVLMASRGGDVGEAEAIVVLGAAQYDGRPSPVFQARLDHAVGEQLGGVAPVVVVTGGRREGDRFTEASAAAGYLIRAGIPEGALRLESDGSSSWESLAAAARFLRAEGITDVVLVSSPYHALRTEHIAAEVGLDGHASPSEETEGFGGRVGHLVKETLAVGVGRVVGHRRLVDLEVTVDHARR
jgi:uncharacterized SAM-binding protein YcdF (DUF218 family)